ncbi:MAG: TonB family protein, partial [Alphaproteobacteria bacterium]|nr:TonB family protein [Alphaproteobacteria bacterium]
NALLLAGLLTFSIHPPAMREASATLVSVAFMEPRPPPPPDDKPKGASGPRSRGITKAPSPTPPPLPLATPTAAQVAIDPGAQQAGGLGAAPGSGVGQGGSGEGNGAGGPGSGRGAGIVTPPVHIGGGFTGSDYRAARLPRGTLATVRVSFRVRSDGAADQCRVTQSSGFASVDDATCRAIEERFRFRPALDAGGHAFDWTIGTEYTWAPR